MGGEFEFNFNHSFNLIHSFKLNQPHTPQPEAPRERFYRYVPGVHTEGPDIAFHLGEEHTVNVLIVICVGSARKAPALRVTATI